MKHLIKPQLVKDIDYKKITYPLIAQRKWNGVRALLWVLPDGTKYFQSRALKPIVSCQHILDSMKNTEFTIPYAIDGEIVVDSIYDDFNKSSGLTRRLYNSPELVFKAFDILNFEENITISNRAYNIRYNELLSEYLAHINSEHIHQVQSTNIHNEDELNNLIDYALEHDWEGLVVKKPSSLYSIGKRNWDWQRIIFRQNAIAVIHGIIEGEGKCSGMMGKMLCSCNGKTFFIGTGFNDDLRRNLFTNTQSFKGKRINFSYKVESPDSFIQPAFVSFV